MNDDDYEKRSLEQIFGKRSDIRPRKKMSEVKRRSSAGSGSIRKVSRVSESEEPPITFRERFRGGESTGSGTGKKIFLLVVLLVALAGIAFVLTNIFAHARVVITPKTFSSPVELSAIAYETPPTLALLSFETVTKKTEKTADLPALGSQYKEVKASGTIKIFNSSGAAATLSPETRFTGTTNGKVYKTGASRITIPAGTKANPGTREVMVYAGEPGSEWNAPLQDFTIPGFQGTPKFTTIIARSVTPMSGGVKGTVPTISPTAQKEAETKLLSELESQSLTTVREQVPEGFVLLVGGVISGKPITAVESTGSGARLSASREDTFILFKKDELIRYLAEKYIPNFATSPAAVHIPSFDSLSVLLPAGIQSVGDKIPVTFSGTVLFEWVTDEVVLVSTLLGAERKALPEVFKPFETIEKAEVYLTPVWLLSLPTDPNEIEITR